MKTKINLLKALFWLSLSIIFSINTFASFYISVDNWYAWKSSIVTSSKIWENISGKISIEKPDWEKVFINEKTWIDWKINSEILWYHTKKAWEYNLEIKLENWDYSESKFFIYPSKFSLEKSTIFTSEKSIAVNIDTTDIIVKIVDRYWNPIKWNKIKIFSSRAEDQFLNWNWEFNSNSDECKTDQNWRCSFEVKSKKEWSSVFTAINLSENKILNQRVKIIFYTEEEKFAIGWNPYLANLLDVSSDSLLNNSLEFWVIDWFKINTSDEIILNSDDNLMTISAIDEEWNIVKDYLWDIKIVIPNDENAIIPWEWKYSFTREDQWIHEFSLSTVFTRAWNNKIEVYEVENWEINANTKWVKILNVKEKKEQSSNLNEKDLKIISPSNWTRLWNNSIQISWKWTPFTDLKIYINEKKEWDLIAIDKDWFYSAKINWLNEWENEIHVTENQWSKRSSESVNIFIDTTAPFITDVEIFPKEIEEEESFNLKIYSEKWLSTIKALVNWNIEILKEVVWTQWVYEINILWPSESWVYPIDLILSDSMWNKETYRNQWELNVKQKIKLPADKIAMIDTAVVLNKIQLKWQIPESQNDIENYEIFLWESVGSLELFWTSKVNDVNIENLKFKTNYFIWIKSVNEFWMKSEVSDLKSVITWIDPNEKIEKPVEHGSALTDIFKKKDDLNWFAWNSRVTLKWNSLSSDSVKYKIEYWIEEWFLQESVLTKDNANTYYVQDLINWLDYFFQVYWVDEDWNKVSKESNILKMTPQWISQVKYWWFVDTNSYKIDNIDKLVESKKWRNTNTWPELYFLLAIALLIWDFMHRKLLWRTKRVLVK